jgi:hypothetical protein
MKTNIKQIMDSYVYDNEDYIEENGGNAAEYILADTEAEDQGWLFFLSDEEIEKFENDKDFREDTIFKIKEFVNENYDYQVRNYNVIFNDDTNSNDMGFENTRKYCEDFIKCNNGTDYGYFEDYKGGTVSIVCNESDKTVFETKII